MKHRRIINYNIGKYDAVLTMVYQRSLILKIQKEKSPCYQVEGDGESRQALPEFEANFQLRRGGKKWIWATDGCEANREILNILKKADGRQNRCETKSMVTEEIELNEFLAPPDRITGKTDLGEYIV